MPWTINTEHLDHGWIHELILVVVSSQIPPGSKSLTTRKQKIGKLIDEKLYHPTLDHHKAMDLDQDELQRSKTIRSYSGRDIKVRVRCNQAYGQCDNIAVRAFSVGL
ncbi:hypothetical protein XPA_000309 [Xanthoria parietina]